jgi:outer membrane protein OmpU
MKKFLLSTSAIVGLGLIAAPVGAAEKIKLSLGGNMSQYIGYANAEDDTGARETASFDTQSDAEVHFKGSTTLDNGFKIAVKIEMEGDAAAGVDESYMDISKDGLGNLRIGMEDDNQSLTIVRAPKGIDGSFDDYIPETNITMKDGLDSPTNDDSNKILYFSPRISGVQVSAGWEPEADGGDGGGDAPNYFSDNGQAYALAVTYKGALADVGVSAQYGYRHESGDAALTGLVNHSAGLSLSSQGFTLGGGYARTIQDNTGVTTSYDGSRWEVGMRYAFGPSTVGVYHHDGSAEGLVATVADDSWRITSVNFDHKLSDGVTFRSTVFNVDYDEETNVDANEQSGGWGVIAGVALSF